MIPQLSEFYHILPEIMLLVLACVTLVVDVYLPEQFRSVTYQFAQASLIITAVFVLLGFPATQVVALGGQFVNDGMAATLKVCILILSYFALFYAKDYLRTRGMFRGEYFMLALFAVLGMMIMVSGNTLLTLYLGLELLSLSLYAMVAMGRGSSSASEAAMKYFVLGALASGMLLYGMSMLYGATGSLNIQEISAVAAKAGRSDMVLVLGLVFLVVGVAFKLGAVPFHMWIPDVYQGAQTPVTLFVGTAPKLAGFAMTIRLLVGALDDLQSDWGQMLAILAVLSMAVGNLIALAQTNIKRMLAYSTIAHVGFLFLGLIAGNPAGYGASMFYIMVYALMAAGGFGMVIVLSREGFEADHIDDFKGLNKRGSWYAFMMLVLMFSMAGVPPFVGFWAKWSVLREVVAAGHIELAVIAVLFSVIGVFYYLRIIKNMYFSEPEDLAPLQVAPDMRVMISTNAMLVLGLGLFPGAMLGICVAAFPG